MTVFNVFYFSRRDMQWCHSGHDFASFEDASNWIKNQYTNGDVLLYKVEIIYPNPNTNLFQ